MLLQAENLQKEYKRGGEPFLALNDVSLAIGKEDFILITGRSGSGKSTLLNLLAGLLPPTQGAVVFNGQKFSNLRDDELSRLRNEQIGFIPQGQSLLPNLTVLDNVLLPFRFYRSGQGPVDKAWGLLEQMGIPHLRNAYPGELSGGELRRITIARGLINSPVLLLADEPTGDLDPETGGEVMKLFSTAARSGVAIVLVTHNPEFIPYGNRHWIMERGRLVEPA